MISTLDGGIGRDFVLGLVDDLVGAVVIDESVLPYLVGSSGVHGFLEDLSSRENLFLTQGVFESGIRGLFDESHELKRRSTYVNARSVCSYGTRVGRVGAKRIHAFETKKRDTVMAEIKLANRLGRAHSLDVATERSQGEVYQRAHELCEDLFWVPQLRRDSFAKAVALSVVRPVTLLTADQDIPLAYYGIQNEMPLKHRFEMGIVYPERRALSYFIPELVKSERFVQALEAVA
ncbi:MAG: hypothetical protein ACP5NS_03115 [Candidatus Pacearchaeota archaeon]